MKKHSFRAVRGLCGALCAAALLSCTASGQTISTWTGGGPDNTWSTTGNWSGAGVPLADISENGGNNVVVFSGTNRPNTVNNLGNFIDDGVLQFSGAGTMTGGRPVIGSTSGSGNATVWLNTSGATTFSGEFAGNAGEYDLAAATDGLAALGWTMLRRRKRHAVRAAASLASQPKETTS